MGFPYIYLLKTSWRYACKLRSRFLLVYLMFFITNIASAAHPLIYGWFINALQKEGTAVIKNTWIYISGFILLKLAEWAFFGPGRVMERHLAFKIGRNYMQEIYHNVLHLPVKWHQDNHTGSTINRVRKAYESLKDFFQNGFIYLHTFCKLILSFGAMVYFSPILGIVALFLGALTVWVIFLFDKPFVKTLRQVNESEHVVASTLFDSLSNIMTVITLRLEKRMITGIISKVQRVYPAFKQNVKINEIKWFTSNMLVALIFGITVLGYAYQNYVPGQVFYMGGLVTLLIYVNQFTSVFNDIAHQYTRVVEYSTDIHMAQDIIDAYKKENRLVNLEGLPVGWQKVEVRNLNYAHSGIPDDKLGILSDMNIEIQRGKRIALIGESGSGKSTLLSILRGLHIPASSDKILIDGKFEKEFCTICNNVTLFPQDPEIFENTILYNITLGLPFSEEEVIWASDIAEFTEVAKNLPNGFYSNIQEKGVNLSGGQKQRLALARGILSSKRSDIILLDEPTSSVDPKTEALIYNNMFKAFSDKAIISSIHRLHLLNHFDYAYLLESGKIVAEGSFKELHANSDKFYQLWKHQEQNFDDDSIIRKIG